MKTTASKICVMTGVLLLLGLFTQARCAEPTTTEAVTAVLNMQAEAWNRGDLDAFMTGYLQSPDTSYTSGGVEVWGYSALRDRYQKRYGDSKATMGKLQFTDLKIFDQGPNNALCIGHWHLDRSSEPPIDGIFSLVLVHTNAGWKVFHDHTSVIDKQPKAQ